MFNSKNDKPLPPPKNGGAVETLIGRHTEVSGDVRFTGGLHVDGRVIGNVTASPDKPAYLSVSESASVEGNVRVAVVVLNGQVIGDVYVSERVTLGKKARITGNVYYKLIEMHPGAQINGQLVHETASATMVAQHPGAVPGLTKDYSSDSRIIDVQEIKGTHAVEHPG